MHPDAEKVNIASGLKLKWAGTLDMGDFYKKMKVWLESNGYGDENKNFKEVKYVERVGPGGKQIEVKWLGEKNVSDYFSYLITITFFITRLRDVEVPFNGKKIKMNQAGIEIKFSADMIKNRTGRWDKNSIMKKLYEKFVIKDRMDNYQLELYQKIYSFHDEVKTYLDLHKF